MDLAWESFDYQAQRLHSLDKIVGQLIRVGAPHSAFTQRLYSVNMPQGFDNCDGSALEPDKVLRS
jgi:hypothetical protein